MVVAILLLLHIKKIIASIKFIGEYLWKDIKVKMLFYYSFNIIWIPVLIRNRVELYDDYFIFYYGFGKEKIFIKDVLKIEKSNNSIASSANSLDRIHLITTQKDFYISLKNNDNFIDKIKQRR